VGKTLSIKYYPNFWNGSHVFTLQKDIAENPEVIFPIQLKSSELF
jgi:hypothetical protein